jgi:hypothetical protein
MEPVEAYPTRRGGFADKEEYETAYYAHIQTSPAGDASTMKPA